MTRKKEEEKEYTEPVQIPIEHYRKVEQKILEEVGRFWFEDPGPARAPTPEAEPAPAAGPKKRKKS